MAVVVVLILIGVFDLLLICGAGKNRNRMVRYPDGTAYTFDGEKVNIDK